MKKLSIAVTNRFDFVQSARVLDPLPEEEVNPPPDVIPEGAEIGVDLERDRERGLSISPKGVVVIAKGDGVEHLIEQPASS